MLELGALRAIIVLFYESERQYFKGTERHERKQVLLFCMLIFTRFCADLHSKSCLVFKIRQENNQLSPWKEDDMFSRSF